MFSISEESMIAVPVGLSSTRITKSKVKVNYNVNMELGGGCGVGPFSYITQHKDMPLE